MDLTVSVHLMNSGEDLLANILNDLLTDHTWHGLNQGAEVTTVHPFHDEVKCIFDFEGVEYFYYILMLLTDHIL